MIAGIRGQAAETDTPPLPPEQATPTAPGQINDKLPTLWIAGDSTAANGGPNATGWGVLFPKFFDPTKLNVVNRARGGRSSRTFVAEGLWDKLLGEIKAGDIVLIQFGHNDGGAINEEPPGSKRAPRARASLPGLGNETREIDNIVTKQHEVVHTFGWYMRKMIADTKAKGATPLLLSLTIRNVWKEGKIERSSGNYRDWIIALAHAQGVAFVDHSTLIAAEYQRRGETEVKAFFPKDYVHTGPAGAELNAALVVAGLRALRGDPLGKYLSAQGAAINPAERSSVIDAPAVKGSVSLALSLPTPARPELPSLILIGDSTVRNGRGDGAGELWGWGEPLADYFDLQKINVVNRAIGGLSSRTYLTGGHWEQTLAFVKPGDYVLIQFGHNDNGALNDEPPGPLRARGTIRGIGEETKEIDNALTKQHEVVHTYGWYLRRFVADAKAKGAVPIICSLIPKRGWRDGRAARNTNDYARWAAEIAQTCNVGFVDLNEITARQYDKLGEEEAAAMFGDSVHTTRSGAELNAASVVAGLRTLAGDPFRTFLSEKGQRVAGFIQGAIN